MKHKFECLVYVGCKCEKEITNEEREMSARSGDTTRIQIEAERHANEGMGKEHGIPEIIQIIQDWS